MSAGWIQYGSLATSVAVWSNCIACTSGWISVAACGPMMCAPMMMPVSRSTSTFANPDVSAMAQPYAVPP